MQVKLSRANQRPTPFTICVLTKKTLSQAPYILGRYTSYQRERGRVDANAKAPLLMTQRTPRRKSLLY